MPRVLGYGYSQSARFLRSFLKEGFNADLTGRIAFDGMFIASAGAGGGSFNHRFAMPGQAGNSVLSDVRPWICSRFRMATKSIRHGRTREPTGPCATDAHCAADGDDVQFD